MGDRRRANSTEEPVVGCNQKATCSHIEPVGTGDKLDRVPGQRRDTPGNQKWSGRWESNPRGKQFLALKTSGFVRWRMPSVISV
jgi:hypothetical protein